MLAIDVAIATGDVLVNDGVPNLVTDVTTAPYGSYTFELNADDPAVAALTTGETLTDSFEYTVRDADGDLGTVAASVEIGEFQVLQEYGDAFALNSANETLVTGDLDDTLIFGEFAFGQNMFGRSTNVSL